MAQGIFKVMHEAASGLLSNRPTGVSTGGLDKNAQQTAGVLSDIRKNSSQFAKGMENQPRWWTKAFKTMGIQVGVAGILKQSQIFTSFLGSIFQIFGAFVDVMLAPWIPVIVPAIRRLAQQVPKMRVWAQKIHDWIVGPFWSKIQKIYNFITKDLFSKDHWIGVLKDAGKSLYNEARLWTVGFLDRMWGKLPWPFKGKASPFAEEYATLKRIKDATETPDRDKKGPGSNGNGGRDFDSLVHALSGDITTKDKVVAAALAPVILAGFSKAVKHTIPGRNIPLVGRFLVKPVVNLIDGIAQLPFKLEKTIITGLAKGLGKGTLNIVKSIGGRVLGKKLPTPSAVLPKKPTGVPYWDNLADESDHMDIGRTKKPTKPPLSMMQKIKTSMAFWQERGTGGTGEIGGSFETRTTSKPTNPKLARATKAYTTFKSWLTTSFSKLTSAAKSGGRGLKTLVEEGFQLGKNMITNVRGTVLAKAAAKVAARFIKMIPFLGAAYMGAETSFDLRQIAQSDKGWTGDLGSTEAWMKEGAGAFASLMGEGKGGFMNPIKWARKGAEYLPGVGDWFKDKNETLTRWKKMQAEGGALSSGKALDFGIRAITGYGGAGMSWLPLLGQLAGGAMYEAGAYQSMGQFMGMDATGKRKYGDTDMAGATFDMISKMFEGVKIDVTVGGEPGTLGMTPAL